VRADQIYHTRRGKLQSTKKTGEKHGRSAILDLPVSAGIVAVSSASLAESSAI
jgi:hypothetical protein